MKLSLYGAIAIPKAWCPDCKQNSFLVDRELQCCGRAHNPDAVTKVVRESDAEHVRLSESFKKKIFDLQHGRCYLCGIDLSKRNYVLSNGKPKLIRPEYDHFIPRSFGANNNPENIFLMCNICNGLKSDKIFETKDDAIEFVMKKRSKKGLIDTYTDFEIEVMMSEDAQEQ